MSPLPRLCAARENFSPPFLGSSSTRHYLCWRKDRKRQHVLPRLADQRFLGWQRLSFYLFFCLSILVKGCQHPVPVLHRSSSSIVGFSKNFGNFAPSKRVAPSVTDVSVEDSLSSIARWDTPSLLLKKL